MCEVLKILPLNHCMYKNTQFEGHWTYFKSNKKSQIDFVLTNNKGRQRVEVFNISKTGWHFSDHLPVDIEVSAPYKIDALALLTRAKALNEEYSPNIKPTIKCFKNDFDINEGKRILLGKADAIMLQCQNQSADYILDNICQNIDDMLQRTSIPKDKKTPLNNNNNVKECDDLFRNYLNTLKDGSTLHNIEESYQVYQVKRNELNRIMSQHCHTGYKYAIESQDDRRVWTMIDWSGNADIKPPTNHPSVYELSEHFSELYEPIDQEENLHALESNVTIPVTDDPITPQEIHEASQQMKKGGYDYPISVLRVIVTSIFPAILLLLNTILFSSFPLKLATSILSVIPKLGNLALPTNYRGIQIQPLVANLYDRVLSNRLLRWVKINDEQTAFQKGKGTIDQIFLIRIIIALAKLNKATLYVVFFDLSKAFDRVSRFLLLKALVKMGVGYVMLNTLKCIYSNTRCILKGFGKLSEVFDTYTGIKQGASSSVILFIAFLDDIIDILKERCAEEPILGNLHCLLHADDTLLLSTNRELFRLKCNILIKTIKQKKMSLNYTKSGYLIINPKKGDIRCDLKLDDEWLDYTHSHKYLGVYITDSGNMNHDIAEFLNKKNKDVNIKLANFVRKNALAPIVVKLKVLRACVNSSLTYACETWGSSPLNNVEVLQRKALKISLNIKQNTANEIVYIESGFKPLKALVYKRQLKFFRKFRNCCESNTTTTISKIFLHACEKNIYFLRHYKKLDTSFANPQECYDSYVKDSDRVNEERIKAKYLVDINSALGTYHRINPELKCPELYEKPLCMEYDRKIITQYRTGSHELRIQRGRLNDEQRNERLCKCNNDIQSVEHMLFSCPYTEHIRQMHNYENLDLTTFFRNTDYKNLSDILKSVDEMK